MVAFLGVAWGFLRLGSSWGTQECVGPGIGRAVLLLVASGQTPERAPASLVASPWLDAVQHVLCEFVTCWQRITIKLERLQHDCVLFGAEWRYSDVVVGTHRGVARPAEPEEEVMKRIGSDSPEFLREAGLVEEFSDYEPPKQLYDVVRPVIASGIASEASSLRDGPGPDATLIRLTLKEAPTVAEVRRWAVSYFRLWECAEQWVIRKIASVDVIDRQSSATRFSYDVDLRVIRRLAQPCGPALSVSRLDGDQLWLPLHCSTHHEYFGVDVKGPWARRSSLASSRESTLIALLIVLGCYLDSSATPRADMGDHNEYPLFPEWLNQDQVDELYAHMRDARMIGPLGKAQPPRLEQSEPSTVLKLREGCRAAEELLDLFCHNDLVVLMIPDDSSVARANLSIALEATMPSFYRANASRSGRLWSRIGGPFMTKWLVVPEPFSDWGSWRIRVRFPSAARVVSIGETRNNETGASSCRRWSALTRSNEVQIYGTGRLRRHLAVEVVTTTSREYFAAPAFAISLLLLLMSVFVTRTACNGFSGFSLAALEECAPIESGNGSLSLLTTVLSMIPTFAGGLLLVRGEHSTVTNALGASRVLLTTCLIVFVGTVAVTGLYEHGGLTSGVIVAVNVAVQWGTTVFFLAALIAPSLWQSRRFETAKWRRMALVSSVGALALVLGASVHWLLAP